MFKNLLVYRVGPDWSATLTQIEDALAGARFSPCGTTQPLSAGWTPPRGAAHGPLIESIGGQWLMQLTVEQKVLPGSVVKRRCGELAARIEQETGRKPGKRQGKEIKEQATLELLPMAFTKQAAVLVWLDTKRRLLMLDAGSAARAEDVVTHLVKALPGFAVQLLQTTLAPATAMAAWLASGEAPSGFSVDRECELKSADEMKSVVRYARHPLDTEEVRQHIAAGKQPTRLAMTWHGRVSFVLTDALHLKKVAFDDVVFEAQKGSRDDRAAAFDADAAISTAELCQLIPDLVEALDGELQPGASLAPVPAGQGAGPLPAATARPLDPVATDDAAPPWA